MDHRSVISGADIIQHLNKRLNFKGINLDIESEGNYLFFMAYNSHHFNITPIFNFLPTFKSRYNGIIINASSNNTAYGIREEGQHCSTPNYFIVSERHPHFKLIQDILNLNTKYFFVFK